MTNAAKTGQALAVLAGGMLFAAFTSAMVVRRGIGADWVRPDLPLWVWPAAGLLLLSSLLVRSGKTQWAALCGLLFLATQTALIRQLRVGEVADSSLWVLATAHAAHAAGGIFGLLRFGARAEIFWHFVGLLWLYVLVLFGVWA